MMDKIVLALIADVLYAKGIINDAELDGLMEIRTLTDVGDFTEKMLRGEFVGKRGERYTSYAKQ